MAARELPPEKLGFISAIRPEEGDSIQSPVLREAQDSVIDPADHLGLLYFVANGFLRGRVGTNPIQQGQRASWKRVAHVSNLFGYNDMVQDGYFGLAKAAKKFDPNKGFQFSTYAVNWIGSELARQAVNNYLPWRVPVNMFEEWKGDQELYPQLGYAQHRPDTPYYDESLDELDENGLATYFTGDYAPVVPADDIVDLKSQNAFTVIEDRDQIKSLLADLDQREKEILLRRAGFITGKPETLEEVGTSIGLTREGVRQIEKKTLQKIRDNIEAYDIQDPKAQATIEDYIIDPEKFGRFMEGQGRRYERKEAADDDTEQYNITDQEKFEAFLADIAVRRELRARSIKDTPELSAEECRAAFEEQRSLLTPFSIKPERMPQGYTAWFNQVLKTYYAYMKTPEGSGIRGFKELTGIQSNIMTAINTFCGGILGKRGRGNQALNFELFELNEEDALSILTLYFKDEFTAEDVLTRPPGPKNKAAPRDIDYMPEVRLRVDGCDNCDSCILKDGGAEWFLQNDKERILHGGRTMINGLTKRLLRGRSVALVGSCEKAPNGSCVIEGKKYKA